MAQAVVFSGPTQEALFFIKSGDTGGFMSVVDRKRSEYLNLIKQRLKPQNRDYAEDILEDAYVKMIESAKGRRKVFRGCASLYSWCYRIVFNTTMDFLRKEKRRIIFNSIPFTSGPDDNPEDANKNLAVQAGEPIFLNKKLAKILEERLSEEDGFMLVRRYVFGDSIEELCRTTGLKENTAKVKIFRAREKIRKYFEEIGIGPQALLN